MYFSAKIYSSMLLQCNMEKNLYSVALCWLVGWFSFEVQPNTATHTHAHTQRLSSLPSQCLLATASNSLHLSLVHSASESASLIWSIPSLTASHVDHRKTHRRPSQQHLSQLPWSHWSVWLSVQPQHFLFTTHSVISVHSINPGWADRSRPGSGPSPGVHSRVEAGQGGKKMKDKKKHFKHSMFSLMKPHNPARQSNTPLHQHRSCQSGSIFVLQLTHQSSAFRLFCFLYNGVAHLVKCVLMVSNLALCCISHYFSFQHCPQSKRCPLLSWLGF